jgi:hypothetical protein
MTIKQLAQKLRHAADVLDELIGIDRATINETPAVASKIRASFKKRNGNFGFRYKGTHWTQQPKNRARLQRMVKRNAKARANKTSGGG